MKHLLMQICYGWSLNNEPINNELTIKIKGLGQITFDGLMKNWPGEI